MGRAGADEKTPVRVYTNEDLERVRPFRDQTGVGSKPETRSAGNERAETSRQDLGGNAGTKKGGISAEERWRAAAQRLQERLQDPRDRAQELRDQIEERRRQPGVRPYSDPKVVSLQRRLEILERRIREAEAAFEDRARRQGALPGWIR
jgi:hypothetical protein